MSLDQKIGQLFIFGFPEARLTPELTAFIRKQKPGAFVLFKRNMPSPEETKTLNAELYRLSLAYSGVPPLLAVDQEGGSVVRISTTPPMPNALSVGQTNSAPLAEAMGSESARLLKEFGFNMNLAPVLDVADPFKFSFIGVRSFGADPQSVGKMGYHFSKGLILQGVIPTGKHFPGTGSAVADPHRGTVLNNISKEEALRTDLPPFADFSKLGFFSALMLSQLSYPHLDPSGTPAVFSKPIISDLLRRQLHFRGLIMTDDLQMSASRTLLRPPEAALAALKAGADLVMLSWSFAEQSRAVERVKKAVGKGELSVAAIDQKLLRILRVKHYISPSPNSRLPSAVGVAMASDTMRRLDDAILEKNTSAASGTALGAGKACVFSSSARFLDSFRRNFHSSVSTRLLSARDKGPLLEAAYRNQRCSLLVFTVLGVRTARLLKALPQRLKARTFVANLALPGLLEKETSYRRVVNLYFPHQNAGKKIAQLLSKSYAINAL